MKALGPHSESPPTPEMLAWSQIAPAVKQVNGTALLAVAPENATTIYRWEPPVGWGADYEPTPEEAGARYGQGCVDALGGFHRPGLIVEASRNERSARLASTRKALGWPSEPNLEQNCRFTRAAAKVLNAHGYAAGGLCSAWGEGDEAEWLYIKAQGYCGLQYLLIHCYGPADWNKCDDWSLFRWRRIRRWLNDPTAPAIIVSETGIDAVYGSLPGYLANGLNAEQYAVWLEKLDAIMYAEDVRGVIFTGGGNPRWQAYSIESLWRAGLIKAEPVEVWPRSIRTGGNTVATLAEQYPTIYREWVQAGGIETNFRAHLIGIGVLKPTADDLKTLAGNTLAAAQQLKNALTSYPFA